MAPNRRNQLAREAQFHELDEHPDPGTPEYADLVACRRARCAVAEQICRNAQGHLRFQELHSVATVLSADLETSRLLRVAVNPIRVWALFETPLFLDGIVTPPTDVLFFPIGNRIHAAALGCEVVGHVRELAGFGPCTIDEWLMTLEAFGRPHTVRRRELTDLCRQLADMGIVAFL